MEEDRYKEMLNRSDSENVINSYFKLKRTSQLLGREAHKGHGKTRSCIHHWRTQGCDDQRGVISKMYSRFGHKVQLLVLKKKDQSAIITFFYAFNNKQPVLLSAFYLKKVSAQEKYKYVKISLST